MSDVRGSSLRGAVDLSALVNRAAAPARPAAPAGGDAPGAAAAAASGLVVDGTDQNFTQLLEVSNSVPVLVDLWASWSEASVGLSAVLQKLVVEYGGRFVLARVEIESNPQLTQAFQAAQVPTVAAVIAGRPVGLFVGALPEEEVREAIEQVLAFAVQNGVTGALDAAGAEGAAGEAAGEPEPEPLPPLHQEAYDAIERGELTAAIDAYQRAIAQNPADELAKAGLAQVSLLHRLEGKTLDEVRAAAAAGPDDVQAQLDVADLDLSGGHVEDAFDRLLGFFARAGGEDRNTIRERLVELFTVVGADDPRVAKARSRLASLLY